jgi:hypothetical protein
MRRCTTWSEGERHACGTAYSSAVRPPPRKPAKPGSPIASADTLFSQPLVGPRRVAGAQRGMRIPRVADIVGVTPVLVGGIDQGLELQRHIVFPAAQRKCPELVSTI